MNIIIAVFLYLGLTYPGDTIYMEEVAKHRVEIEATKTDPTFLIFYQKLLLVPSNPGIAIVDHEATE